MKRLLYGDVHPETAMGLNNLAYLLESRGNFDGAATTYREALAVNRKLLGASHPTIALNLSNIAFGNTPRARASRRSTICASRST